MTRADLTGLMLVRTVLYLAYVALARSLTRGACACPVLATDGGAGGDKNK
jgi:hypothetical protein